MKFIEFKFLNDHEYESEIHVMNTKDAPKYIEFMNTIFGNRYSTDYHILSRREALEFINEVAGNDFDLDKRLKIKFRRCYGEGN